MDFKKRKKEKKECHSNSGGNQTAFKGFLLFWDALNTHSIKIQSRGRSIMSINTEQMKLFVLYWREWLILQQTHSVGFTEVQRKLLKMWVNRQKPARPCCPSKCPTHQYKMEELSGWLDLWIFACVAKAFIFQSTIDSLQAGRGKELSLSHHHH